MNLLLLVLVGGAWAFYATLLLDRPDLAAIVVPPWDIVAHAGIALFMVVMVYRLSHREIMTSKAVLKHGPGIYLRNFAVVSLGILLLIFISHTVLHGVDPTGVRKLW